MPPSKRFLVIEDDKPTNESLQRKLQRLHVETDGCFDGAAGLEKMRQGRYDGILLDLMMPIKDGFAVLSERGGTLNAETPVYVLTTLGEEKCQLARELGARKTFTKADMSAAQVIEEIRQDLGL
jgi:DNA-binding response OmpR family regulator